MAGEVRVEIRGDSQDLVTSVRRAHETLALTQRVMELEHRRDVIAIRTARAALRHREAPRRQPLLRLRLARSLRWHLDALTRIDAECARAGRELTRRAKEALS